MGYRSDVRIRTTKDGFEALKNEVEKLTKKNKINNLLTMAERIDTCENVVTIDWGYVKWYEFYEDVKAITNALSNIQEQGFSWVFARIGEDYEDIEIEHNIQDNNLWGSLDISINRSFED